MGFGELSGIDEGEVKRNKNIAEAAKELEQASNGILTERQAHAYVAREIVGLSRQETTGLLGVKLSTVDSLYYKAREKVHGAEALVEKLP